MIDVNMFISICINDRYTVLNLEKFKTKKTEMASTQPSIEKLYSLCSLKRTVCVILAVSLSKTKSYKIVFWLRIKNSKTITLKIEKDKKLLWIENWTKGCLIPKRFYAPKYLTHLNVYNGDKKYDASNVNNTFIHTNF